MNIETVKKEKNAAKIELKDASVGFAHMIKEELWNDKRVDEAAAMKEHPYMENPKIYVKTKRTSPERVLKDAAKELSNKTKDLKTNFKRAFKK